MISIDPKIQAVTSSGKIRSTSKREKERGFNSKNKVQGVSHNESVSAVADIGGMLFLQEIDQLAQDKEALQQFAKKTFNNLKNLQLSLLEGKMPLQELYSLKGIMSNERLSTVSPEIEYLGQEIRLRIEVEIAKIEINIK